MTDFDYWSPTYIAFGKGKEARTGELVRRFGGHKVLLHFGGGSAIKSGLIDRVKASLAEAGVDFVELGGVKPNGNTLGAFRPLTADDVAAIYRLCL